jgi:2-dehydropantoate 2-reductase
LTNKIAIVGKGAIGSLLAYQCEKLRFHYQLLLKEPVDKHLEVIDLNDVHSFISPHSLLIDQANDADIVILPIKAYQVSQALDVMQPILQPNQAIVLLHNGMGTIDEVKKRLPENPLIAATTSYGALKLSQQQLKITGLGQTHLGWINSPEPVRKQAVEQKLTAMLPPSQWHDDIHLALWKKLAINGVINPITATKNVQNGDLANSQYHSQIITLCEEIAAVMQAEGYTTTAPELHTLVMAVVTATALNYSSMHQDIQHHRRTEIDFINGYIVGQANKWGLKTPMNAALLNQVKQLESLTE